MYPSRFRYTIVCVAFLLFAGSFGASPAQAQSVLHRAGLGLTPVSLSSSDVGDIDGDGDLDLVVTGLKNATFGNPTATIYENQGGGTFAPLSAGISGVNSGSSDFADVDGDNDLDLVVTGEQGFTPSATVYENDGSGNFSPASAGLNGVQDGAVAFGDIEGDGDLDLVVTGINSSGKTTTLYENDGSGTFSSVDAGLVDVTEAAPDFADIDGDGDQDLILVGSSSSDPDETTVLYENDGSGNFSELSQTLVDVKGSADFGDVDGDNDPDLLLTGFNANGSRTTTLYKNDGSGTFSEVGTNFLPVSQGNAGIGDLTGDGNSDVIVAGRDTTNAPTVTLYVNDGQGGFSPTETSLTGAAGSLNLGDIEGDGDSDLVLTGADIYFGASARLYVNNTVQTAPNRSPQVSRAIASDTVAAGLPFGGITEFGDPDGDSVTLQLTQGGSTSGVSFEEIGGGIGGFGFLPSVSQSGTTPSFTVEASDGNGANSTSSFSVRVPDFYAADRASLAPVSRSASAFGDIDSDGDQDVVLTGLDTSRTPQAFLYESDGQGGFSALNAGLTGVEGGSASFSDIEGDGDLDLLITGADDFNEATATLYENDGSGNFSSMSTSITPLRGGSAAFGDVDGDDDSDLVLVGSDQSLDPTATLYLNDGSGSFSAAGENLTPVSDGSADLADVEGDGDLDLLITGEGSSGGSATLYTNDGSGSFSEASAGLGGSWVRSSAAFGDLDGDADPDLVIAGEESFSPTLAVYENDGSGNFSTAGMGLTPISRGDVDLGDINGDGHLDLIAVGQNSNRTPTATVYGNDGTGTLTPLGVGLQGMQRYISVATGDVNGNGTLDLLVSGDAGTQQNRAPLTLFYDNLAASAITASSSTSVGSDGTVDFGATGIDIAFSGTSGSGEVTVKKLNTPPNGRPGIAESNVSTYRFLVEAGGGLSFDANTTLRFDVSTLSGISDPGNVTVYKRGILNHGSFSELQTSYDSGANELVVSTGRFSEFVLASNSEPLPVDLAGFEATADQDRVRLRWQTTSETQNAGFAVQRRRAGSAADWQQVGFVASKAQGETDAATRRYRFTDTDLPYEADRLTYRLKQVDTDGSASVSSTVTVRRGIDRLQLLGTYPNPARTHATVRFAVPSRRPVTIQLYDALGRSVRTVAEGPMTGRNKQRVDLTGLPSGLYFLQLRAGSETRSQRLTVIR